MHRYLLNAWGLVASISFRWFSLIPFRANMCNLSLGEKFPFDTSIWSFQYRRFSLKSFRENLQNPLEKESPADPANFCRSFYVFICAIPKTWDRFCWNNTFIFRQSNSTKHSQIGNTSEWDGLTPPTSLVRFGRFVRLGSMAGADNFFNPDYVLGFVQPVPTKSGRA